MPITNVQSCRAGHAEYPHLNLPHFLIDRQAPLMVGLLVVGVAPRLLGLSAGWRALSLGWAASTALVILWFTATLTLINPNACFLYSNETLIEQPAEIGYLTLRHTRQATAFIAEAAAAPRPWFLYLSYPNAHTALFAMDENRGRSAHGLYGDNVEEMDWSVGEVLAALDASGERDDTVVYFASDKSIQRGAGGRRLLRVRARALALHAARRRHRRRARAGDDAAARSKGSDVGVRSARPWDTILPRAMGRRPRGARGDIRDGCASDHRGAGRRERHEWRHAAAAHLRAGQRAKHNM